MKILLYSIKATGLFALSFLLFSTLIMPTEKADAQEVVCPQSSIRQYTFAPEGNSRGPALNADGSLMAFFSSADLLGPNNGDNNEIWLVHTTSGNLTQITNETDGGSEWPSIDNAGNRIAFNSEANINGGNSDGNDEIYYYNALTNSIIQVTDTSDNDSEFNRDSAISGNGLFIAFSSNADFVGNNPDGSEEVFLFNILSGVFTQITDISDMNDTSDKPNVNFDGTRITFRSNGNINGGNPDGNFEVYFFDTTTGVTTQLTNTPIGISSDDPSISDDGTKIAFNSGGNFDGTNPGGFSQIWMFDTTTGQYTNATNLDQAVGAQEAEISGNGGFVAFRSRANINGGNPQNESQIYIYEVATRLIGQITFEPDGFSEEATINFNGLFVGFDSPANINGGNPDLSPDQIYLARCFNPQNFRNIPTLSEWGLIAMAGVLGLVGFLAIRRKIASV